MNISRHEPHLRRLSSTRTHGRELDRRRRMPQSHRRDHDGSTRRRWSGSYPGHLVSTLKRNMLCNWSCRQFSTGIHRHPQPDQPPDPLLCRLPRRPHQRSFRNGEPAPGASAETGASIDRWRHAARRPVLPVPARPAQHVVATDRPCTASVERCTNRATGSLLFNRPISEAGRCTTTCWADGGGTKISSESGTEFLGWASVASV